MDQSQDNNNLVNSYITADDVIDINMTSDKESDISNNTDKSDNESEKQSDDETDDKTDDKTDDETDDETDEESEEDDIYGTSGLINIGNTCYMNSVIQCLSNIEQFKEYIYHCKFMSDIIRKIKEDFLKEDKNTNINVNKIHKELPKKLTYQLHRVFKALWDCCNWEIKPITFRRLFGLKIELFRGSEQQDSQEALLCILNTIHEELESKKILHVKQLYPETNKLIELRDTYKQLKQNDSPDANDVLQLFSNLVDEYPEAHLHLKAYDALNTHLSNSYSIINALFQIMLHTQITCPHCGHNSHSFEPSYCVSISIPEHKEEPIIDTESQESSSDSVNISSSENILDGIIPEKNQKYVISWNKKLGIFEYILSIDSNEHNEYEIDTPIDTESSEEFNVDFDSLNKDSDVELADLYYKKHRETRQHQMSNMMNTHEQAIVIDDTEYTIYNCLDNYTNSEKLDDENKWFCDKCQEKVTADFKIDVWLPPKILIVHIKRFLKTSRKIYKKTNKITFPIDDFDITSYVSTHNQKEGKTYKYKLIAINNHTGLEGKTVNSGINYGHYYTYGLNSIDHKWYNFNDSNVDELNTDELVTNKACLLFYQRIDN